jgi:hypothetical protein
MRKQELKFQNHIIDSYKNAGGHARKWASEFTAGNPDLVCSLPGFGVHLMEVKHRPEWIVRKTHKNPLTALQQSACLQYRAAGGFVTAGVVVGGTNARTTSLGLFDPLKAEWDLGGALWSAYVLGEGYWIRTLLENFRATHCVA